MIKLFILSIALLITSSEGLADATPRVLRVVTNEAWWPYMYRAEDGAASGMAIEILNRAARTLNLELQIDEPRPWLRQLSMVASGDSDVVAGMYRTAEREASFEFSEPYATDEARVFVAVGREFAFADINDLFGKVGVMPPGGRKQIDGLAGPRIRIREVADLATRLHLLNDNNVDFMIIAHAHGIAVIKKFGFEGKIVALPIALARYDVCFAFSRRTAARKMLPQINEIIRKLRDTGELDKLSGAIPAASKR